MAPVLVLNTLLSWYQLTRIIISKEKKKLYFRICQEFVWLLCSKLQLANTLLRSPNLKGFLPTLDPNSRQFHHPLGQLQMGVRQES